MTKSYSAAYGGRVSNERDALLALSMLGCRRYAVGPGEGCACAVRVCSLRLTLDISLAHVGAMNALP